MADADYPYVSGANGGVETDCQYDASNVTYPAADYWYVPENDPQAVLAQLQDRPLAIAFAAGDPFLYYTGGVLDSSNADCDAVLNHAMVLVGYTSGTEEVTQEVRRKYCRKRRFYDHRYRGGCSFRDEFLYQSFCCWYEYETVTTSYGESDTWLIQNSWGADWGEDGFVPLVVEDGEGVCGMNVDVSWVVITNE